MIAHRFTFSSGNARQKNVSRTRKKTVAAYHITAGVTRGNLNSMVDGGSFFSGVACLSSVFFVRQISKTSDLTFQLSTLSRCWEEECVASGKESFVVSLHSLLKHSKLFTGGSPRNEC